MGAYSVPGPVLSNDLIDTHVQDVLIKDFLLCCRNIKQGDYNEHISLTTHLKVIIKLELIGFAFNPPARRVQMILNDYMRVSMDFKPYAFYSTSKTSVFAVTHASEVPMANIRVNAYDGWCFYKKV